MSGDSPYSLDELVNRDCPFCNEGKIDLLSAEIDESEKCLRLVCECSNPVCPTRMESGSFVVNVYPPGTAHAYFF